MNRFIIISYRGLDTLLNTTRTLDEAQTNGDIFESVEMIFDSMRRLFALKKRVQESRFLRLCAASFVLIVGDGCFTMWNDDIGRVDGGLFHYQAFSGFRRIPFDYYFRFVSAHTRIAKN